MLEGMLVYVDNMNNEVDLTYVAWPYHEVSVKVEKMILSCLY